MGPTLLDMSALLMMSPTFTGKVRVSSTRYRNDPYRARVNPYLSSVSPIFENRKIPVHQEEMPVFEEPAAVAARSFSFAEAVAAQVIASSSSSSSCESFAAPAVDTKPAPKASSGPVEHFALIGFKHETAMYRAPFRIAVGDVVIVEADRGEHIGVVQEITTTKPSYNVPSSIVRRASAKEIDHIDELTIKEKRTTAQIQKLAESFGLGIRVNDTEFQMDGNKMTVFFSSRVFVDFRKLQRSLFREFRCRIWLVNWAEVRPYTPVPVNAV